MATSSNLMLVVKEIDGKGYGLFATSKMPKGTRILSEDIVGIFRVPSGLLSRINHACNNNARYHWNSNISRHTVHAIQDIEEGEEITINYLTHNLSQVERLEILLRRFNFTCSCKLCMSSPEDSLASDKRLFDINLLEELIQRGIRVGHAQCCLLQLRYLDSHNRLYIEEKSTTDGSPRSILAAAIICSTLGDLTRARVLALNAKVIFETAFGSDSIEVIETMDLARNPSMWRPKGYWSDWNTSTDAIPVGLTPEAFDDWLWRRPKPMLPQRSGQLADLRSRINFLGFADLPGLPKLHRAEFFDGDNNNANPKRHWVYLAEITYCDSNYRPGMLVMDMDNTQHPVYLNENSLWWATPGTIQKGYTIAVLYATRNKSPADYHEADIVETDDRKVNVCRLPAIQIHSN